MRVSLRRLLGGCCSMCDSALLSLEEWPEGGFSLSDSSIDSHLDVDSHLDADLRAA